MVQVIDLVVICYSVSHHFIPLAMIRDGPAIVVRTRSLHMTTVAVAAVAATDAGGADPTTLVRQASVHLVDRSSLVAIQTKI